MPQRFGPNRYLPCGCIFAGGFMNTDRCEEGHKMVQIINAVLNDNHEPMVFMKRMKLWAENEEIFPGNPVIEAATWLNEKYDLFAQFDYTHPPVGVVTHIHRNDEGLVTGLVRLHDEWHGKLSLDDYTVGGFFNQLKQRVIREEKKEPMTVISEATLRSLSLIVSGANPGAAILPPEPPTIKDVWASMSEAQKGLARKFEEKNRKLRREYRHVWYGMTDEQRDFVRSSIVQALGGDPL